MIGFLFLVILLVISGAYSVVQLRGLSERYSLLTASAQYQVNLALTTEVEFKKQVQEWKNILLRGENAKDLQKYNQRFLATYERVHKKVALLRKESISTENRRILDKFMLAHQELQKEYMKAYQTYLEGGEKVSQRADRQVRGKDRQPTKLLDQLVAGIVAENKKKSVVIQEQAKSTMQMQVGLLLLMILIAILTSMVLAKMFSKPVQQLNDKFQQLADKKLTTRATLTGQDEIGEMARNFNRVAESIQKVVQEIQLGATDLSTGSQELAASMAEMKKTSEDISESITNEASALQQSSGTVAELVNSMESTFNKIKAIRSRAENSEISATKGTAVVRKTSETMAKIESSSQKISKAIMVITEIANQTNLLSLNAAIEAAKAGESGKGFAVVADEVRNLAEKSGHSVRLISALLEESTAVVQEGTQVVVNTENAFREIIREVQGISQELASLSSEVTQQEAGLREISQAVDEISGLSEENATGIRELSSSIEESDRTTDDLSLLAQGLLEKTHSFEV